MVQRRQLIIYHSTDFDGVFSAAIALKKFPRANIIGWTHGDEVIDPKKYHKVIIVDLPLRCIKDYKEREINYRKLPMEKRVMKHTPLIWIDHHISSIKQDGHRDVLGSREVGFAACELAWDYFFFEKRMPKSVRLAGRYDVWDLNYINDESILAGEVMKFQKGLNTLEKDPYYVLRNFINTFNSHSYIKDLINKGKTILNYQRINDKQLCEKKIFYSNIEEYKAVCLNIAHRGSDVFDSIDKSTYDVMLTFSYNGKVWSYTVYTNKENIDVSLIAKKYGGGGHKGAAGFITDKLIIEQ